MHKPEAVITMIANTEQIPRTIKIPAFSTKHRDTHPTLTPQGFG
jgi:hypothetical protein